MVLEHVSAGLIDELRRDSGSQRRAYSRRHYRLRRLLAGADLTATALALLVAAALATPDRWTAWRLVSLPVWIVLFKLYGLYDRDARRLSHSTIDETPWLFHATVVGAVLTALVDVAVHEPVTVALEVATALTVLCFVFVARASVRAMGLRLLPPEQTVFVGSGAAAQAIAAKTASLPSYGLEPIGWIAIDDGGSPFEGLRRLGDLSELSRLCHELNVERIAIEAGTLRGGRLTETIRVARELDIRVTLIPELLDTLGHSVAVDSIEGITVFGINPPALNRSSRLLKRGLDIAIASLLLVLTSPFLLVIAILVKATSKGPILYRQERVGRRGTRFHILKFRTMVVDAEEQADALRPLSRHSAWLLLDHDPRITRIGRTLRHWSLDELPQLTNVLRGDMSLVGPRPMPPEVDNLISGWGRRRLDLTPGITGLWQVLGRTALPFEEMVKLDYVYVTNWSLWEDIRLLIRTLPAVARRRGAN